MSEENKINYRPLFWPTFTSYTNYLNDLLFKIFRPYMGPDGEVKFYQINECIGNHELQMLTVYVIFYIGKNFYKSELAVMLPYDELAEISQDEEEYVSIFKKKDCFYEQRRKQQKQFLEDTKQKVKEEIDKVLSLHYY